MSVYQRGRNFWIQYYVAGKQVRESLGAISATDAKIVEAERLKAVRLGLHPELRRVEPKPFNEMVAEFNEKHVRFKATWGLPGADQGALAVLRRPHATGGHAEDHRAFIGPTPQRGCKRGDREPRARLSQQDLQTAPASGNTSPARTPSAWSSRSRSRRTGRGS